MEEAKRGHTMRYHLHQNIYMAKSVSIKRKNIASRNKGEVHIGTDREADLNATLEETLKIKAWFWPPCTVFVHVILILK